MMRAEDTERILNAGASFERDEYEDLESRRVQEEKLAFAEKTRRDEKRHARQVGRDPDRPWRP
jgi:hypothetical protein